MPSPPPLAMRASEEETPCSGLDGSREVKLKEARQGQLTSLPSNEAGGQLRAKNNGWPIFDGKFVNYPRFKREWVAYRETYHSVVYDDLAAKTLREKCVKGDAWRMV